MKSGTGRASCQRSVGRGKAFRKQVMLVQDQGELALAGGTVAVGGKRGAGIGFRQCPVSAGRGGADGADQNGRIARRPGQHVGEGFQRPVEMPLFEPGEGQIGHDVDIAGRTRERGREMRFRLGVALCRRQRRAQVGLDGGIAGVHGDRPAQRIDRPVDVAEFDTGAAEDVERIRIAGIAGEDAPALRDNSREIPPLE